MGGSASKNKGNAAERDLAKFLGEVFEGSFVRSAGSGAFVGGKNAHRKKTLSKNQVTAVLGDIVPPDHMPRLVIESKSYKDFRYHQLFRPEPCTQLETWIGQCLDVVEDGDFWVIAWKINLIGWSIAIPECFEDCFVFENYVKYTGPQGGFVITDLKTFFINNRHQVEALSASF